MGQNFNDGHGIRLIEKHPVVRKAERRSRNRGNMIGRIVGGAGSVFIFLLGVTIFVFLFCHSAELQNLVISKLYKWQQAELQSDSLRQTALRHENEVNRAAH